LARGPSFVSPLAVVAVVVVVVVVAGSSAAAAVVVMTTPRARHRRPIPARSRAGPVVCSLARRTAGLTTSRRVAALARIALTTSAVETPSIDRHLLARVAAP
jgi:hypothetical protein